MEATTYGESRMLNRFWVNNNPSIADASKLVHHIQYAYVHICSATSNSQKIAKQFLSKPDLKRNRQ